ncbi:MAG: hypothetical protein IJA64_05430 [Rikenellaceae bacterium]|nr:hypothetical protein [Rikenellaceae bacterium]
MKKYLIMVVFAMAAFAATAQEKSDKMLYVIDGKVVSKAEVDALPSNNVRNINVVKGIEGVTLITTVAATNPYGEMVVVGTAGKPMSMNIDNTSITVDSNTKVVRITSEKQNVGEPAEKKTVVMRGKMQAGDPLVLTIGADGKYTTVKDMNEIDVEQIKSMSVLKNESAEQYKKYGDVSNGVIIIELR